MQMMRFTSCLFLLLLGFIPSMQAAFTITQAQCDGGFELINEDTY